MIQEIEEEQSKAVAVVKETKQQSIAIATDANDFDSAAARGDFTYCLNDGPDASGNEGFFRGIFSMSDYRYSNFAFDADDERWLPLGSMGSCARLHSYKSLQPVSDERALLGGTAKDAAAAKEAFASCVGRASDAPGGELQGDELSAPNDKEYITTHVTLNPGKYAAKDMKYIAMAVLQCADSVALPSQRDPTVADTFSLLQKGAAPGVVGGTKGRKGAQKGTSGQAKYERVALRVVATFGLPTTM